MESLPADSQSNAEAGVAKLGTARVQTTPHATARPGTARIQSRSVAPSPTTAVRPAAPPSPAPAPSAVAVAKARRRVVDTAPAGTGSTSGTGTAPRTRSLQSSRTVLTHSPQSAPPTPRVTATQRPPAHTGTPTSARPSSSPSDLPGRLPSKEVTAALPSESVEPAIQPVAGEGTTTSADHDAAATESPAASLNSTADAPAASDFPADDSPAGDSPLVESTSTKTPTAPVAGSGEEAPPGSTAGGTSRQASPAPRTVPRVAVVDPQAAAQVANEQRVAAEGYRQRADRLLDRARRQWEAGHREEALRLAQIAHRLELAQKAVYRPDEESPSRFIATLQSAAVGDTLPRPPAATSPAATHVATPALAGSDTPQSEPANVPSSDTPASRGVSAGTTDLVTESPTAIDTAPSVNAPAVEQLTGSHRFHRAAHRQPGAG
ncbi:MAG: hypothetical protein ACKO3P_13555, partial [Planctomycetaceae bacterium]